MRGRQRKVRKRGKSSDTRQRNVKRSQTHRENRLISLHTGEKRRNIRNGVAGLPVVYPHVLTTMLAGLLSILAGTALLAQQNVPDVPRLLSYQGVLVEPDGVKVPDATYVVTIKLYDTPAGGTPVWEETQSVVTLDGVFDAILGLRTPLDDTPFDRQYWLAVQLQGEAEMTPRTMVVSAPYALRAYRSSITDSIVGGHVASVNNLQGHIMLQEGDGIAIVQNGQDIMISATGSMGGGGELSYGSIWYGDTQNMPTERPIGNPYDVLTVNAAGTEPVWSNTLKLQRVDVDSLLVEGHARITGTVLVDNDAHFTAPVLFDNLPDFPLQRNAIIVGSDNGRAAEYPSSNSPGQVLRLDDNGTPVWQDLELDPSQIGLASGRVATNGTLRQTIPETAIENASKIVVTYEDPDGGPVIPVQIVSQNPGTDFTVIFTALPPEGTFLVYTVMP